MVVNVRSVARKRLLDMNPRKKILIICGGTSPEHEVSIITGLQVFENIDTAHYEPLVIYLTKKGEYRLLPKLKSKKDFLSTSRKSIVFGTDIRGGYIKIPGPLTKKQYPYAVFLALHGGTGESGAIQGLLESLHIAFTSVGVEAAAITLNKKLTKDVLATHDIRTVTGLSLYSSELTKTELAIKRVIDTLGLPVIIKPVHLGSSIGIEVATTAIELEKKLLTASQLDSEILVEKYLPEFIEYNCAVRLINGKLEASEIEQPISHDQILSFADKYERGGKKTNSNGMASLSRELPAKISPELKLQIQETAKRAFSACRCRGMVRIDFMKTPDGTLYLTEINSIPGSMAFYLWEASGIPFKQQITDLIEEAVTAAQTASSMGLDYQSDIVEKFTRS